MSDVDEAREIYVNYVIDEHKKAHDSSVRLLIIYRLLRIVALVASAVTPVLVLLDAEKIWTTLVAACAAVALGLIQLTSLDELSLIDRDRADRLRRAIRRFKTEAGPYAASSDNNRLRRAIRRFKTEAGPYAASSDNEKYLSFIEELEEIRSDWARRREALVRRSFIQDLTKPSGASSQDTG